MKTPVLQECRSVDGVTVGLVDAISAILPVLVDRDLTPESVQDALKDLLDNPMLRALQHAGGK